MKRAAIIVAMLLIGAMRAGGLIPHAYHFGLTKSFTRRDTTGFITLTRL
jgi:hypothetical protein